MSVRRFSSPLASEDRRNRKVIESYVQQAIYSSYLWIRNRSSTRSMRRGVHAPYGPFVFEPFDLGFVAMRSLHRVLSTSPELNTFLAFLNTICAFSLFFFKIIFLILFLNTVCEHQLPHSVCEISSGFSVCYCTFFLISYFPFNLACITGAQVRKRSSQIKGKACVQ